MAWEWFGQAGHLCVADRCQFHLHTHVGKFCVSTVGEFQARETDEEFTEIGFGRLYETMVFPLKPDGTTDLNEVDMEPYNDRDAANAEHLAVCMKLERF